MTDTTNFDTANIEIEPDKEQRVGKKKKTITPVSAKPKRFGKVEMPFVILGIGLFVFLTVYVGFSIMSGGGETSGVKTDALGTRLSNLEARISQLHAADGSFAENTADMTDITKRLDRLEATVSLKLNVMEKKIAELSASSQAVSQNIVTHSPKPTAKTAPPAQPKQTKKAPATPAKPVYHTIRKGETFYSISRKYGLTVEKLQQMNNLKKGETIYPGQKLLVKK